MQTVREALQCMIKESGTDSFEMLQACPTSFINAAIRTHLVTTQHSFFAISEMKSCT